MLRPGGYIIVASPEGCDFEADTFTCSHCQQIVIVPVKASASDPGGWCGCCAKPVCGPCADTGVCTPWEKQMERMEARDRMLRSIGF